MKKIYVSLVALAAALAIAPVAHADQTPGWYAGAGVGATFPVNPTLHTRTGSHDAKDENQNLDLLGNGGYAWSNGLRLEGEYFHNQNNTKSVAGVPGGGHVTNNALFANVFYDFKTGSMYTPYIGAGVGPDFINVKSVGAPNVGYLKGDTADGAYQGIVGVAAQLDRNWAVTADYRYIASFDPKVDSTAGGQGRMDNASHNVVLGLRYSFAEPAAPVMAAAPVPMPMRMVEAPAVAPRAPERPVVAPVAQNFTVFFDFDRSTLTPEAKRIIATAAQEYQRGGFARITVTGHTDTVGTATYNEKLSQRRAMAVEVELKRLGVDTDHIKEIGVGKNDLLVPTADGVREAQNRRAQIVLTK
ncbi:MAG: outer membrane beta-barrel protein [Alphaproteobacteria bacterium]|nr:outer membrane beta-barrel protein [Alphaproteobacteria bacterium]